jgi:hypothetical protein
MAPVAFQIGDLRIFPVTLTGLDNARFAFFSAVPGISLQNPRL